MKPSKESKMTPRELRKFAKGEWMKYASAAELEEYERWRAKQEREHKLLVRRERRYRNDHLDGMDITSQGRDSNGFLPSTSKALRISTDEDYLDLIFSERPEDLHELVSDEAMIAAVKKLTPRQKEALHCFLTPKTKTADVALILGTSDRNILKLLATAKKNILQEIGETK